MAEATSAPLPGPVSAALQQWLAPPEVLGDPFQLVRGRVWTRVRDVLPGARVRPGIPVCVAWGDLTWTALPQWDDGDPETLWLVPLGEPIAVPDPVGCYTEPGPAAAEGGTRPSPAHPHTSEPDLAGLLADFQQSLRLLMGAIRDNRRTAQAVLAALDRELPDSGRGLLSGPAGLGLLRMARRAAPPYPLPR